MSSLLFNISLGRWHLQIDRRPPIFRLSENRRVERPWWKLTVFCAFGVHFDA